MKVEVEMEYLRHGCLKDLELVKEVAWCKEHQWSVREGDQKNAGLIITQFYTSSIKVPKRTWIHMHYSE